MTTETPEWMKEGRGNLPYPRWSFATDAPLSAEDFASESGDCVAADESGGLYRIDRRGKIEALTRTSHQIRLIAIAGDGETGAAVLDDTTLALFDRRLQFRWTRDLPDEAIGLAMSPLGTHVVVCLTNGVNLIYDADKRKICSFESLRPLRFVEFLPSEPALIAAADYGFFARYGLSGELEWSERLWTTVNDLCLTGTGDQITLAALTHGLQVYNGEGASQGTFVVEGTPHRVSSTYSKKRIAAATLEQQLMMVNLEGQLQWLAQTTDEIRRIRLSPLGDWLMVGFAGGRLMRLDMA